MTDVRKTIRLCASAIAWLLILIQIPASAQADLETEKIAVVARPSRDSIILRWAPLKFNVWQHGNQSGYTIERYVISRNGALLGLPERTILTTSLTPLPEEQWQEVAGRTSYAAIAAQALYGDQFEIDLKQSDIFTIANKVQENEQRFYFALFSADMSPAVAKASGLLLNDTTIAANEKYLYRISVTGMDTLRGSIFIDPMQAYQLPEPQNLKLDFKDRMVSLRWDRMSTFPYTAWIVERSEDGITFRNILESPITTLSPDQILSNEYEYATDSVPAMDRLYYYRIKGLTPFGELGPASQVVSGRSIPVVGQVPYIIAAVSEDNQTIEVQWDFPEHNNRAIQGFTIDRASSPSAPPSELTVGLLAPGVRSFRDSLPGQSNYYRVRALGHDDQWYSSHLYFSQLIDSIPPSVPTQLKATADDEGIISISWAPNKDKDIFGYRVYKANHQNEEVVQLTVEPITIPEFRDTMDLNILNESVYYSVMSIDIAQNHSRLSELLEVKLPDKVRPQPPVLLPVSSTTEGIVLTWLPTPSHDVVAYQVFRKETDDRWILLNTIQSGPDSLFTFTDQRSGDRRASHYTVIAVDDAGLESEPSHPVQGVHKSDTPKSSIQWRKARLRSEENEITLSWTYTLANVDMFTIFRSENSNPFLLHKIIPAESKSYKEQIIPGRSYKYRIMVSFKDGSKSSLSDELVFQY